MKFTETKKAIKKYRDKADILQDNVLEQETDDQIKAWIKEWEDEIEVLPDDAIEECPESWPIRILGAIVTIIVLSAAAVIGGGL